METKNIADTLMESLINFEINEDKLINRGVRLTKVKVNDISYKRVEYFRDNLTFDIQWLFKNEFIDEDLEKKLEITYQKNKP